MAMLELAVAMAVTDATTVDRHWNCGVRMLEAASKIWDCANHERCNPVPIKLQPAPQKGTIGEKNASIGDGEAGAGQCATAKSCNL